MSKKDIEEITAEEIVEQYEGDTGDDGQDEGEDLVKLEDEEA